LFIASVIAADRLGRGDISAAADAARAAGLEPRGAEWIEEGSAFDLRFERLGGRGLGAIEALLPQADVIVQPEQLRRRRLLVADMDSTMIAIECIDELADYAGLKSEVAEVTERAMRGELAFEAALEARVALLSGLAEEAIDRCYEERVRMTPGAVPLVRTMRANGAWCLLVSGGFSRFANRVAAEIGFNEAQANSLCVAHGRLTGSVAYPILGAEAKRTALLDACRARGVLPRKALAVGDGANDIPMLAAAGLGVAYRAKPRVAAEADARVERGDLTALLFAQGYKRADWVLA
jgi:phosphoserine phosphatase